MVTDEAGEPLAGIAIRAVFGWWSSTAAGNRAGVSGRTGPDDRGIYRIATLFRPGEHIVAVPSTMIKAPSQSLQDFPEKPRAASRDTAETAASVAGIFPSAALNQRTSLWVTCCCKAGSLHHGRRVKLVGTSRYPTAFYPPAQDLGDDADHDRCGEFRSGVDFASARQDRAAVGQSDWTRWPCGERGSAAGYSRHLMACRGTWI